MIKYLLDQERFCYANLHELSILLFYIPGTFDSQNTGTAFSAESSIMNSFHWSSLSESSSANVLKQESVEYSFIRAACSESKSSSDIPRSAGVTLTPGTTSPPLSKKSYSVSSTWSGVPRSLI